MQAIFFFNTLAVAGLCLLVFIWLGRSRILLLKTAGLKLGAERVDAAFDVPGRLLSAPEAVSPDPCDVKNTASSFVRHNLTSKDCRLCGYALITIIISTAVNALAALAARGSRLGFRLLLLLALLLGSAYSAQAATVMCSEFGGVVDGSKASDLARVRAASTFGIDMDCTIKNFPESVGGFPITNINFQFPEHASYLIIFDNVYYDGNMSCNDPTFSDFLMWMTNDSFNRISSSCQEFFIPVDGIRKNNPAGQTTAAVGEPFTYTLTFPDMAVLTDSGYVYSGRPDTADIYHIQITDDLTATGADLSYVDNTAVLKTSDGSVIASLTNSGDNKHLSFSYINNPALALIPAGTQLVLEFKVVLDDTSANVPGKQFINTAHWELGRMINGTNFEPLPGQDGITQPMTIVGPNLVVNKTSSETALNLGVLSTFTIDVQNNGGSDAWDATILDRLPDGPNAGMCDYDPTTAPGGITAQILAADNTVVKDLTPATDFFAINYSGTSPPAGTPACQLSLMMNSAAGPIAPYQHLVITYKSQIDGDSANGIQLTNVAGATRWFSGDSSLSGRRQYDKGPLTDGTTQVLDFQDAATVTTALSGYYFQKTVENRTTGANPATTAAPGNRLRYKLRLFNIDQNINEITISDLLDPNSFDLNTFTMVTPPPAGAKYNFDSASGLLTVSGDTAPLDIAIGGELVIEFEITLKSTLASGTVVSNQANLSSISLPRNEPSDDPYVNGVAMPFVQGDEDPTTVVIQTSGPLSKANTQATAAIGEQFKYRITVPAVPVNMALHDVRILDDLSASAADLRFVSVAKISGSGIWTPVNSGSDTNLVIEDTHNGIDIPAGEQAVVEVTVELLNTPKNVVGLSFTNTADYTYNQVDNTPASQADGLPGTTAPMQIIGLNAQKTVSLDVDNNSNGLVDPGDMLLYTITVNNQGAAAVTGVVLTDDVPANTTYEANSVTLNGAPVGQNDGGISPLTSGLSINSAGSVSGTMAPGTSAVVTFRVQVNAGVPAGTVISNQGFVTSNEESTEPTDADGNPDNGYQPTTIVVGSAQQVMITKEVSVVGGGAALPGSELEYVVRVTNTGTTPTTNLVITDNLTSLAGMANYVAGSATFNGTTRGVSYASPVLTADYANTYGNLLPGATATLRFRVLTDNGLAAGTRLTNTAQMAWNTPTLTATASVSIDIGGAIGTAMLNGRVWHDANLDKLYGTGETNLANWTVSLYRNNALVATATTDANGLYSFNGLDPTLTTADKYELRFAAPAAGPNTASMGQGDSPFTNGPQRISDIIAPSGANLQNLNLPLWPNGAVYNSVGRQPVAGARVTLLNGTTGAVLPSQCFDDPVQQNQATAQNGFYKFDLNFSNAACPAGGDYLIEVTPPATGYMTMPSQIIPPASDASTAAFSVPLCPGDAVPGDAYCEAVASADVPPPSVQPRTAATIYHMHLLLNNGTVPGQSQIFNNFIPIDPELNGAVAITKTTPLVNVTRGGLVPYTITLTNVYGSPLPEFSVLDRFPAGFKYVAGSARLDGKPVETNRTGRELTWRIPGLQVNQKSTIQLLLVVGSGVTEDEYVNRAYVIDPFGNTSPEATATVRVIPDPTFDCTDVIGKVFDDRNLNGYQDKGEKGLPGVRVVTVRGLIATSDKNGRFHITCAAIPDEDRGSNFILKLDERTLPSGYRLTTENPRVQRATRGKMLRFDFGATIHHVVRIDISDGAFAPNTTKLRLQWVPKIEQLLEELKKAPSVLRLSYLADVERKGLVKDRLDALKNEIAGRWEQSGGGYRLTIETEIFWRRGAPVAGR